ncbi:TPA: hypothetical protein HA335_00655 [Methanocaldococcus jannaschii]|uniref:Putative antitoxin VapB1 n=2 Tax=Methanocaldococcus jannaschii TaxID=2190 RepID=VAPB1_METJA|nr:hypothetical protein [Methanocaldococcus jannaschii]P0CW37.1 RecName: Full=Putative antitoxin VapB1 [Methanocaldococcus jannaschii DSM 2661]HII59084.1 hypothetical protein [Methanocaldococcus jannaschii]
MISAKSKTKRITITFEIPEDIDAKKFKDDVKRYVRYKLLANKLYELLEGENIEEIEEEIRKRRE